MAEPRIITAFDEIAQLAIRLGVVPLNARPGCWEFQVDEHWWIAVNGHRESLKCSKGVAVEPFNAYVEFNGWPAGSFNPAGGIMAAGEAANEDAFIAALRAAVPALRRPTPADGRGSDLPGAGLCWRGAGVDRAAVRRRRAMRAAKDWDWRSRHERILALLGRNANAGVDGVATVREIAQQLDVGYQLTLRDLWALASQGKITMKRRERDGRLFPSIRQENAL